MTGKLVSRILDIAFHPRYHKWHLPRNFCNVCHRRTVFVCTRPCDPFIRMCVWCRSTPKYRAIVSVVEERLGQSLVSFLDDPSHQVYELTTSSAIYRCHHRRPNYVCSGYFSDKPFQTRLRPGVWNENLQDLHFEDRSFDVVISSETMEHVRCPWDGFAEIYRVLKPGGFHCFTIPYHPHRITTARVDTSGPKNVYLLPRIYHEDPYRAEDSLVYTDFGQDMPTLLEGVGFTTSEHLVWDERTDIRDDAGPMRVFVSEKPR
jgi:SAM-dependent methyltransferase